MALTLGMITTDTTDAARLGTWWAEQTGGEVVETYDGWFVTVQLPGGLLLAFQQVEDPTPGKNRLHLDLGAPDLDGGPRRQRVLHREPLSRGESPPRRLPCPTGAAPPSGLR